MIKQEAYSLQRSDSALVLAGYPGVVWGRRWDRVALLLARRLPDRARTGPLVQVCGGRATPGPSPLDRTGDTSLALTWLPQSRFKLWGTLWYPSPAYGIMGNVVMYYGKDFPPVNIPPVKTLPSRILRNAGVNNSTLDISTLQPHLLAVYDPERVQRQYGGPDLHRERPIGRSDYDLPRDRPPIGRGHLGDDWRTRTRTYDRTYDRYPKTSDLYKSRILEDRRRATYRNSTYTSPYYKYGY